MKGEKTWILTAMIAAFAAAIVWYEFIGSRDDAVNSPAAAASVFNFFDPPKTMPELKFINRKNHEITLEAFKGSFVLLNVWATWCAPCREEMPALDRLQAQLGGADFEVLALSVDEGSPSVIRKFYEQLELESLKVYHDPTASASLKLGVPGIPATFLIDRKGKGLGFVVGPIEWDSPEVVEELKSHLAAQN